MNSVTFIMFLFNILTVFALIKEHEKKRFYLSKLKDKERTIKEYHEVCNSYETAMAIYAKREAGET